MVARDYAPHEGLFLKVFKDPDTTRYFLQRHLPQSIQDQLDLDDLRLENTSYLDDALRKHFSDLVFSVLVPGDTYPKGKVYLLFEHKSAPESLVGLQVLRYMALQWKDLYDQGHIQGGKLPPIVPLVIYQGPGDWQARGSFHDLVRMPSPAFKSLTPDFRFAFYNVRALDPQAVQENVVLKFYVDIIKALDTPKLKPLLPQLTQGFAKSLEHRTALEYIEIFFKYLTKSSETLKPQDYQDALELLPEGGAAIMTTLADQWLHQGRTEGWTEGLAEGRTEGRTEGRAEGQQEILIAMAQEKYGTLPPALIDLIRKITTPETLQALVRDIFRLDDVQEFKRELQRLM
ncbi:MAG: Rpn family recombination-promoting nuclease/putative transposase [Desulfohalobium sp.]